jgi:hypothetical protein
MSDIPRGSSWWKASDGKWYPPELHPDAERPEGWWLASDGNWYPPDTHPDFRQSTGPEYSTPSPIPTANLAPDPNSHPPPDPSPDPNSHPNATEDAFGSARQTTSGLGKSEPPGWSSAAEDTGLATSAPGVAYASAPVLGAPSASRPIWRRPLVIISAVVVIVAAGIAIPLALRKSSTAKPAATSLSAQVLLDKSLAAANSEASMRLMISTTVNGQTSSTETMDLNPNGSIATVSSQGVSLALEAVGATEYVKGPASTLTAFGLSTPLASRYAERWLSAHHLPGSPAISAQVLDKSAELATLQLNDVAKIASKAGTFILRGQLRATTLIPSELVGTTANLEVSSSAPHLPIEFDYTYDGATLRYAFSGWDHVAPATAPTGAVPFERILVESASGPTTGLEHILQAISIQQSDLRSGLTLELITDGDQVAGQVTLDLCSQTYQSESYRVARRQLTVANKNGVATVISTEAVAYTNALAAARAITELKAAAAHCPSGYAVPAEGPPALKTIIDRTPDSSWPAVARVQRFGVSATVSEKGTGETAHGYEIFILRGRILLGIYVTQASETLPFKIGGANSVESLTELLEHRLAELPASAVQ